MISFKQLLGRDDAVDDLLAAHQRMIVSLLDGMVSHAIRGDTDDFAGFQTDIAALRDSISPLSTPEELLIGTGAALRSFQDYNRRTAASLHGHGRELQAMAGMLTETIVHLSAAGTINVARLHDIERQIDTTSQLEDMRKLKERLSECLLSIREEKIRQQKSSAETVGVLSTKLKAALDHTPPCDQLTGLGSRPDAENALAAALDQQRPSFAAFFVIDHLHSLNHRFGRKVGDEIIMMFALHLAQNLRAEDMVFRWSGPSFLAIIGREGGCDKVRRELLPLIRKRLEKTVDSSNRTVLLPINFTWMLFPILEFSHTSHLVDKIDSFLNTQVGPET